jgi:CobQ-like glutamine amidotransferase family enzyme
MTALTILNIFPVQLNVNGDGGNVLALRRRLEWAGLTANVIEAQPGTEWWTERPDIVHIGGGTIAAQRTILDDLLAGRDQMAEWAADGVSILGVAGGYHLLLDEIQFSDGETPRAGLGLIGGRSTVTAPRVSEYTVAEADGALVHGYQNSGQLVDLAAGTIPWGSIIAGVGNRTIAGTEGAVNGTVLGSNLNGPLLPRNPLVADAILTRATRRRELEYVTTANHAHVDAVANQASTVIRARLGVAARDAAQPNRK